MKRRTHAQSFPLSQDKEFLSRRQTRKMAAPISGGAGGLVATMLLAFPASASASAMTPNVRLSLNYYTEKLLAAWRGLDPHARILAEVIATAFASGLNWSALIGGWPVFCPPQGLRARDVLGAFERFLRDHPDMVDQTYGAGGSLLKHSLGCSPWATAQSGGR
jgi:hypothetical protein